MIRRQALMLLFVNLFRVDATARAARHANIIFWSFYFLLFRSR